MHYSFGMLVLSLFIIGITIYFVSAQSDEGAWWYIVILLLGMMLTIKGPHQESFVTMLYQIGFPAQAYNTAPSTQPQQHGNF